MAGAWVPRPLAWATPPILSGEPSPAAVPPLERSRSTGPQPLAAEVQSWSLAQVSAVGGGGRVRTVAAAVSLRPSPPTVYVREALSGYER